VERTVEDRFRGKGTGGEGEITNKEGGKRREGHSLDLVIEFCPLTSGKDGYSILRGELKNGERRGGKTILKSNRGPEY